MAAAARLDAAGSYTDICSRSLGEGPRLSSPWAELGRLFVTPYRE
jgi:hypothetical protein